MAAEYANVNALKYQLRQAQARNAHPDVIADHHLRYSMAESALADKLGLYTPVKEPTIAMEPVLAPLPPIFAHVLREPMAPAEPIANAREKPRGTSFVRKRFRPAHNMERGGAYPQPRGPALSSSTAIYVCLFHTPIYVPVTNWLSVFRPYIWSFPLGWIRNRTWLKHVS
jgi:hypothetical protein